MKKTLLLLFLTCTMVAFAQNRDSTKTAKELNIKQPESVRLAPNTGYIPYFYNPQLSNINLKKYSITNKSVDNQIQKNRTADNALQSIRYTLYSDHKDDKAYKILGTIFQAGVLGGMVYQAINGENLSKKAQERREASKRPPSRR